MQKKGTCACEKFLLDDMSGVEVEILDDSEEDVQIIELLDGNEVLAMQDDLKNSSSSAEGVQGVEKVRIVNKEETCVVAQFLTATNSSIASEFVKSFKVNQTTLTFTWEDVVRSYLTDFKVLEVLLVHKLLSITMPSALPRFEALHPLPATICPGDLIDFVKREVASSRFKAKPHRVLAFPGERFLRFTQEEDETILRESRNKKSWIEIGILLGRTSSVIQNRFYRLTKAVTKRRFSPADDQIILDEVLHRLNGKKLVEFSMPLSLWDKLGTKLNKERLGVRSRWAFTILPTILQHFNGTLNLRLEVMLVNHLIRKYSSIDEISWEEVASKPEFAGHTKQSLKGRVFSNLRVNACQKYGLKTENVTLEWMAEYAREVYGNVKEVRKDVRVRQKAIIDYVEVKVAQLGLKDFV